MRFQRKGLTNDELIHFYRAILKPRLIEEKMLIALRQGRISKWFSGYGQEAISVGATLALEEDEYILPMHRNLGIFTSRNVPLDRLFSQFQGKANGFTKGRDRSFHFGTNEHHLVGMISRLGPQMGIADGIALATKLKKENKDVVDGRMGTYGDMVTLLMAFFVMLYSASDPDPGKYEAIVESMKGAFSTQDVENEFKELHED